MKQPVQLLAWKPFLIMLFLSLISLAIWAQTEEGGSETSNTTAGKTTVTVNTDEGGTWYTSPWVWIVGAAVFILLLVALLSNRGNDTIRVSKTVEHDRRTET